MERRFGVTFILPITQISYHVIREKGGVQWWVGVGGGGQESGSLLWARAPTYWRGSVHYQVGYIDKVCTLKLTLVIHK